MEQNSTHIKLISKLLEDENRVYVKYETKVTSRDVYASPFK